MRTILRTARRGLGVGWVAAVLALAGCASSKGGDEAAPTGAPARPCPSDPVSVVVSVDQWGDIVDRLAGACGRVTTIVTSGSGDPHDYEPTPGDAAAFEDADLVVVNGLDYDPWADKAVEALGRRPQIVNAGEIAGLRSGDNPHVWYGPDYVYAVADAVTHALEKLEPDGKAYFSRTNQAWRASMRPYRAEIEQLVIRADGTSYGATEGVFEYMAAALGMRDATPAGYQRSSANDAEPAPGDLHDFEEALDTRAMAVLFFNSQTEGAVSDQLREKADAGRVPVVEVTESVPAAFDSFESWQVSQLRDLAAALGT